jgi:cell division protein FtsB
MLEKIPALFKNFYFLVTVPYVVWVLFFADNNIIQTYKLRLKYQEEVNKKEYYETQKEDVISDLQGLRTDTKMLERYAREKYFMKRKGEDIYALIKKN